MIVFEKQFIYRFSCLFALSIILFAGSSFATTVYVDADAVGANNGDNWDDAFTTLQPAIDQAIATDEVWVADGTYFPSLEVGGTGDRYRSFQLKNEVAVYGGFDGSETDLSERDVEINICILSADIGVVDDNSDNCYHVFYHPDNFNLDNSARLDGFTITGGYGDNAGGDNRRGAGMFNRDSSPTIANCIFSGNETTGSSYARGGGMCNYYCSPIISHCTFYNNKSYGSGAAIFNAGSSSAECTSLISDCLFDNNSCGDGGSGDGGAIYNSTYCAPIITRCTFSNNYAKYNGGVIVNSGTGSGGYVANCIFTDNTAGMYGGVIYNYIDAVITFVNCVFTRNEVTASNGHGGVFYNSASSPVIANCILYDNQSGCVGQGIYSIQFSDPIITNCILDGDWVIYDGSNANAIVTYSALQQAGYEDPSLHNTYLDPMYTDAANDDFTLMAGSPCIDAGNNEALPADRGDMDDDSDTTEEIPFDMKDLARCTDDVNTPDTGYGTAPIVDMGLFEFGSGGQSVAYEYDSGIDRFKSGNYPNPFSPLTAIRFTLTEASEVNLAVYALDGRLVRTIINGSHSVNEYEYAWDGLNNQNQAMTSGVYFYRLKVGDEVVTRPMVLQR